MFALLPCFCSGFIALNLRIAHPADSLRARNVREFAFDLERILVLQDDGEVELVKYV